MYVYDFWPVTPSFATAAHSTFRECIVPISFGLEEPVKGLFFCFKNFLDYSVLTTTFSSVVMATFTWQELDVSLEV